MFGGGRVDRRGSREGKKSLRRNKQVLNDIVTGKAEKVKTVDRPTVSQPAPPLASNSSVADASANSVIDCGCRLLNRQFDRDLQRVIQRAVDAHVEGMIVFSSDYDKQDSLLRLCKQNSGLVYAALGIHPDNIKHTHDKKAADRLDALREMAVAPECVALFAGLDFSREFATRYAQEKHLEAQLNMALDLHLPVLLTEVSAADRLLEILSERRDALPRFALYGLGAAFAEDTLRALVELGAHVVLTGALCDADAAPLRARVARLPRDRLLLASDAPLATPQSIPDAHMREGRNEPSNLPFVVAALAAALGLPPADAARLVRSNAKAFFALRDAGEAAPVTADAAEAAGTAAAAADGDSDSGPDEASPVADASRAAPPAGADSTAAAAAAAAAAPAAASMAAAPATVSDSDSDADDDSGGGDGDGQRARAHGTAADARIEAAAAAAADAGEAVTYACKACRRVVCGASDLVPHREAAPAFAADTSCQMLFTRRLEWMRLRPDAQGEGKLVCPGCSAKLGRFSLAAPLVCSCGRAAPAPAFRVSKARVDLLVSGVDATAFAALRLDEGSGAEDEYDAGMVRRTRKKKKKTVRASHAGNFSSFRNKST